MEFSAEIILLLFAVGAIAACIDVIAGGGGLITIPVLLSLGIPPAAAIATNKLQASGGSFFASCYFIRNGTVKLKNIRLAILLTLIGAVTGGWVILHLDASILSKLLPFLLIATGLYFLFATEIGDLDRKQRVTMTAFAFTASFALGFYDGFFGPGTGAFIILAFVSLLGFNLSKATAHAKVLNCTSNVSSLIYFMFFGEIFWQVGLIMLIGQFIGAYTGARLVVTKGQKIIRPLVVIVCMAMAIKLILD